MTPGGRTPRSAPWTHEAMLRESARWVHVPPSGVLVKNAERLLVHPSVPGGTGRVWRSRPVPGGADALIAQTLEEARRAGAGRLVWHTGDGVSPPLVEDLLPRHGFEKLEDLEVLAFELGAGPEPELPRLHVPADVGTRPVKDEADLRRANRVESGIFPAATWVERDTRAYLRGIARLQGRARGRPAADGAPLALRFLAFIRKDGREDGEVVATAGSEVAGGTVRLWGAGTLAEHRGRGAYAALVTERCRHAHALGATLALSKANASSSAPILRRAGFRLVARERRYAAEIPAQHRPR